MAKRYPPSLRIVVVETNLDKIDVGKLFLVTYKGGSLGREGTHDVLIPDINISKVSSYYSNLLIFCLNLLNFRPTLSSVTTTNDLCINVLIWDQKTEQY